MPVSIRDSIGFFLQLFPCGILCYLPFQKESMRLDSRRIYTMVAVYVGLQALLFGGIVQRCYASGTELQVLTTLADGYMTFAIVPLVILFFWMVYEQVVKKLLILYIVIFYAATQFWVVNLISPLIEFQSDPFGGAVVYSIEDVILYASTTLLLLPVALLLFIRPLREFMEDADTNAIGREFWFATVTTAGMILMLVYCASVRSNYEFPYFRVSAPLCLMLIIFQCFIYWLLFRESVRRRVDADNQKALEIQEIQSQKIAKEIEQARRMRHDMRHHLAVLYDLVDQNRLDAARNYLNELIGTVSRPENVIYCQNVTVNALLQYYISQAHEENITCRVHVVCDETTISPADLTVAFGNTLDNAIQACRKVPEERWLMVRVGMIHDSLAVEISNSCTGALVAPRYRKECGFLPAQAFVSQRVGGGNGLPSVAHVASKYGGEASFRFDPVAHSFTSRIRFNLHPETL